MSNFIVFIIFILQLKVISTFDDTIDDIVSLNIEDNVIDGKFVSFAKTNIRLSRQSNIELSPSRTISSSQYERLIEESQLNKRSYYTLKVHFKRRSFQDYVMTSIPMCLVLQANFQYTMNLFINENGYIVSVNILTNNSTCSISNIALLEKQNDLIYKIPLHLHFNELGPQPEIQHFLEKLKREREAKLNTQENDNRPFVLKYWKYILPIVVIFVLQSAFTDPGAAAGGNGR
ncbi:unnamed protein product [Rotaria sp. Silwood1]|nr:unnamed protein product [Rotaria sp. Silwood1]CAF1595577.1 unnamed protein product [Rotaria sp. Silwood1]CAF3673412.1 unnamed protein product [Rotaria sp. Silwood1]CAF3781859.1 unnamed protein product [Rotaria sp. Silwood1]CAF3830732.1 unnamed protein product [Rotaria sp. Silwood1]